MTFDVPRGVTRVSRCSLTVNGGVWAYAHDNAPAIEDNWQTALRANPRYFNGIVHIMNGARLDGDHLIASLAQTDFKSYLFWRQQGFPEAAVVDGFGSGLIMTSDGKVILGRQRSGNVNAGLVYLPAGFIDQNDVDAAGNIDIVKGVLREIVEETGVDAKRFTKDEGFFLARADAQLSIAVPFRVDTDASAFVAAVEDHNANTHDPELDGVVAVSKRNEIDSLPLPGYTRVLLNALLR